MSRMITLTMREVRSYFRTATGYIVLALFLLLLGVAFNNHFEVGKPASLRSVFSLGMWMLVIICPAITMGAISEERRQGTFEMLMTSPLSETQIVLAKFFGAMTFLALVFLPTAVHVAVLERYGRPDYGELACGYLGMLLAGAAYLASGIFASTLTASQVLAFLLTFLSWLIVIILCSIAPMYVGQPWADLAAGIHPVARLQDFAIGLLDSANVVYFGAITVGFLIAAVRSLQAGRWR